MPRRSLKPQLNQIRTWARQGRTDAWIAHQLDVSVRDIGAFKREHDLAPAEAASEGEGDGLGPHVEDDEPDLRAEDEALVAAALEAELEQGTSDEDSEGDSRPSSDSDDDGESGDDRPRRRRRGRRGGRGRRAGGGGKPLEGTFDHGEEGYGLWLDPAVQDDPVYAEHWAGHRSVTVTIEQDRVVIERAGEDAGTSGSDDD